MLQDFLDRHSMGTLERGCVREGAFLGSLSEEPQSGSGAQTAPATTSTAPAHQRLGSANAETTPAGAQAAAADKTQTRRSTRREERVTVQGPVQKQQPDGMSHGGLEKGLLAPPSPRHLSFPPPFLCGTKLPSPRGLWWGSEAKNKFVCLTSPSNMTPTPPRPAGPEAMPWHGRACVAH